MGRRSRFEMYVDVLTEIESGTGLPTQIMYGASMNWTTLKQTLETLTAKGLIEEQTMEIGKRIKNVYTLTENGNTVLKYINVMKELLEPEAVEIPV